MIHRCFSTWGASQQTALLTALFSPIYVPEAVVLELDMGRMLRSDTLDPRDLSWVEIVTVPDSALSDLPSNRLGAGEQTVIAYTRAHPKYFAGLDDKLARLLAESLKLRVVGTLGILIQARRAGLIPAVRPLLDAVIAQGFRLAPQLYDEVLNISGENT